jgi:hypothetical protein
LAIASAYPKQTDAADGTQWLILRRTTVQMMGVAIRQTSRPAGDALEARPVGKHILTKNVLHARKRLFSQPAEERSRQWRSPNIEARRRRQFQKRRLFPGFFNQRGICVALKIKNSVTEVRPGEPSRQRSKNDEATASQYAYR